MYSATWPKRGMTRSGVVSAPPTSALHTDANECSCSPGRALLPARMLPTPQARDGDNRGPADPARRRAGGHQVSLHDAVDAVMKLLPTPTASDAKNCTHRTQTGGPSLPDETRLLPIPNAPHTETAGHREGEKFRRPSQQQARALVDPEVFLPTPRATDGTKGCPAQRGSKGDLMLPSAVMRLLALAPGDGIS